MARRGSPKPSPPAARSSFVLQVPLFFFQALPSTLLGLGSLVVWLRFSPASAVLVAVALLSLSITASLLAPASAPDAKLRRLTGLAGRWARPRRRDEIGAADTILGAGEDPQRKYLTPVELPPAPATFVGRGSELAGMTEYLTAAEPGPRVVVIYGPSGIGKTTLAAVAAGGLAKRYDGGRLFADLSRWGGIPFARRTDDELVGQTREACITALKQPSEKMAPPTDRKRQYDRLFEGRPVLVVMDDVDDLAVIERLLPAQVSCSVIVTTSLPPTILPTGWHPVPLAPLMPEESLRLLRSIVSGPLTEQDSAAHRLIEPMNGHPNAIRLTATQLALRSESGYEALGLMYDDPAAELAARRARRAAVNSGLSTTSPVPALHVGFGLLGEDERAALRAVGGRDEPAFTRQVLRTALSWDDGRVARVIDRLLLTGFVTKMAADPVDAPAFRISADVHAFARERFRETEAAASRRHPSVRPAGDPAPESLIDSALTELTAGRLAEALTAARRAVELTSESGRLDERGMALAILADVRAELGAIEPARDQAVAVLALDGVTDLARARALRVLARLYRRCDEFDIAGRLLRQGADAARRHPSEPELTLCLRDWAVVEAKSRSAFGGIDLLDRANAARRKLPGRGADWWAGLLWAESLVQEYSGASEDAERCLIQAEQVALRRAQPLWLAWTAHRYAGLLLEREQCDFPAATTRAMRAFHTFSRLGHRYGRAQAALVLGKIHLRHAEAGPEPERGHARHQARLRLQEARQDLTDVGDTVTARRAAELAATLPAEPATPAPAETFAEV